MSGAQRRHTDQAIDRWRNDSQMPSGYNNAPANHPQEEEAPLVRTLVRRPADGSDPYRYYDRDQQAENPLQYLTGPLPAIPEQGLVERNASPVFPPLSPVRCDGSCQNDLLFSSSYDRCVGQYRVSPQYLADQEAQAQAAAATAAAESQAQAAMAGAVARGGAEAVTRGGAGAVSDPPPSYHTNEYTTAEETISYPGTYASTPQPRSVGSVTYESEPTEASTHRRKHKKRHHRHKHHGSTHHGSTHHGSTHHGSTHHGSTHHGSTHHGSSHHGSSHHGSSYHGSSYHGSSHHGGSRAAARPKCVIL
ncbi:hypothetical protein F5B20DRAFT_108428 [Whalleya microplaca]|nr:hypothetical protein F5B20DRAFT_108428 [Whalleya microplaca]